MTATRFAAAFALLVALQAMAIGSHDGTPGWTHALIGLVIGYIAGLLLWPLFAWTAAKFDDLINGRNR